MSDDDQLEPLPDDMAGMLSRLRVGDEPSSETRANVGSRVRGTLGIGAALGTTALTGKATASGFFGLISKLSIVAIVVVVGAVTVLRYRASVAPRSLVTRPLRVEPTAPTIIVPDPIQLQPNAPETTPAVEVTATHSPTRAHAVEPPRPRERELLDAVRIALGRRDSGAALTSLHRHSTLYPRGDLAEERDAMWIQALVIAGDNRGARVHGAQFERLYPHSVFRRAVEAALASAGIADNDND